MPTAWCSLVLLLVVALTWLTWIWRRQHAQGRTAAVTTTVQRLLKPRTPEACLACRQLVATSTPTTPLHPPVTPWRELKSRRGAPKRIDTAGFACPNRVCAYYRITDAQVHALVGDGTHGRCERRETLRCQACDATFSTRRGYPLGDPAVSAQNRIPAGWRSADSAGRRTLCRRRGARVRASPRHHHDLAHAGWPTQCHPPRPRLSEPSPPTHSARRTADAAAEPGVRSVAVGRP